MLVSYANSEFPRMTFMIMKLSIARAFGPAVSRELSILKHFISMKIPLNIKTSISAGEMTVGVFQGHSGNSFSLFRTGGSSGLEILAQCLRSMIIDIRRSTEVINPPDAEQLRSKQVLRYSRHGWPEGVVCRHV